MAKVQDTYNPVTGEYVKRISDWIELDGSLPWSYAYHNATSNSIYLLKASIPGTVNGITTVFKGFKYDSTEYIITDTGAKAGAQLNLLIEETGFSPNVAHSVNEYKAYFYGWRMANADGTSPYYKSEVPYTPETWAEWTASNGTYIKDSSGLALNSINGTERFSVSKASTFKASTKYGILLDIITNNCSQPLYLANYITGSNDNIALSNVVGKKKTIIETQSIITVNKFTIMNNGNMPIDSTVKLKDIRIFELPTGSQIEADFTNLSADELSAKYTFNGLCVKHWKKVTDGTGLTSTLPTASYAGYTPYRMIYQLATPEISYLTPKATIPLYDTNTIVKTDTPSDCKADVTVGYKLKSGATAVAGDITAPTPDYMSAVNSVSEDGLGKGIVRSPNLITNGNFANGTTGWSPVRVTLSATNNILSATNDAVMIATWGHFTGSAGEIEVGHKIYTHVGMRVTNDEATLINSVLNTSSGRDVAPPIEVRNPIINTWYNISGVSTAIRGDTNCNLSIRHFYSSIESAQSKVMEVKDVIVIDLTATFGAGNEPTKEQCDILFATWQDKASTQTTLPTLRKIGTVADTYNPETGVLVQRIGKKVLDGTEASWLAYTDSQQDVIGFALTAQPSLPSNSNVKNTHFEYTDIDIAYGGATISVNRELLSYNGTHIKIAISKNKAKNLTQFKAWLAQQYANGTPVTVYYQLATPVVTTLTKTALPTYKPTTVIESDSTVKGSVSADYKLKVGATPVAGDFIASPESVNDIKDLGNSIDVVSSVGRRNLLVASGWRLAHNDGGGIDTSTFVDGVGKLTIGANRGLSTYCAGFDRSNLKDGETYTFSIDVMTDTTRSLYMDWRRGFSAQTIKAGEWVTLYYSRVYSISDVYNLWGVSSSQVFGYETNVYYKNPKAELSSTYSSFTPAPENIPYNTTTNGVYKTNILLANPLRSVGDVKDRLFKDSDGKWKVERNVGELVFNGTENWIAGNMEDGINKLLYAPAIKAINSGNSGSAGTQICSHSSNLKNPYVASSLVFNNCFWATETFGTRFRFMPYLDTVSWKEFLASENAKGTPVTIQYQLATPTYETLSQELQTKLDNIPTFPEHNYVYTVTNDNLQPTLHVDYKKLSWLRSRLLVNSLKIYSRNLTDAEMIQNYKVEKERFGM